MCYLIQSVKSAIKLWNNRQLNNFTDIRNWKLNLYTLQLLNLSFWFPYTAWLWHCYLLKHVADYLENTQLCLMEDYQSFVVTVHPKGWITSKLIIEVSVTFLLKKPLLLYMHQHPETLLLMQHTQHNMPKTAQVSVTYATCFIVVQAGTSKAIRIANNDNNCQADSGHKG